MITIWTCSFYPIPDGILHNRYLIDKNKLLGERKDSYNRSERLYRAQNKKKDLIELKIRNTDNLVIANHLLGALHKTIVGFTASYIG